MCTAITYKTKDFYFGRNLDLEMSYNEVVTITPRDFPFEFRKAGRIDKHYAMIGVAAVVDDYPLYFDGTNEKGLSMAGLNFPGNSVYQPYKEGVDNIAPFEFIPWILGQCGNVNEAQSMIEGINLVKINFSDELPLSPLHWIVSDKKRSITVEPLSDGLRIYENPVGVLTNNPTFDIQLHNLNNYINLSAYEPQNSFSKEIRLQLYSRGMGALGLPGDLSSESRFVRAVFTRTNSISGDSEKESISQFFHILGAVAQQRGCVRLENEKLEITVYSSCCNADKGIYYYKTYENSCISGIDMNRENLDSNSLICYPMIKDQTVKMIN